MMFISYLVWVTTRCLLSYSGREVVMVVTGVIVIFTYMFVKEWIIRICYILTTVAARCTTL